MNFESLADVERYLADIPKFQSSGAGAAKFDLPRFKDFCSLLGDPHEQYDTIHVAGTNGKGSTCRILGSVFTQAGYRTGIYTSPHILRFNERFAIGDEWISDNDLVRFFRQYGGWFEDFQLTYFEISTALAFWWFAQSEVDLAVIETGLGGRFDATNIVTPLVSIITSISLDHTDILGETTAEIAREKAGIIKSGKPVVLGTSDKKARAEIVKIAEQKGSKVHTIGRCKLIRPGLYDLVMEGESTRIETNLTTPVQAGNIAAAWQAVHSVKDDYPVGKKQFTEALKSIDAGPGRFSKLVENRQWYFDGAHNSEAVRAMKQSVKAVGSMDDAILILAMMKDKLRPEVMSELLEFKKIYYYYLDFERAATFREINSWLPHANPFPLNRDEQQLFFKDLDSELVIFAGSFYFYPTVRDRVKDFSLNR